MAKQNQYFPQSLPHPGETLIEKLEEMQMGSKEFAIRTGKPEKTISAILRKKSAITPDMAILFEKVTRIPAHYWLNAQKNYDEYVARERHKEAIKEAIEWAALFPIADMVEKGWIQAKNTAQEKVSELLTFFGIGNHNAWENLYFNQHLKIAFRISLKDTQEPHAISAWLRKGELQAAELSADAYSGKILKEILPEIKKIMVKHPNCFFAQLQAICLTAGVKVIHTPCIKKAPISGCTRWINDTPLIQLSGRYKRNDTFWFTFFHEIGHILLHGKKDVFMEVTGVQNDAGKEEEANNFAVKWTLSEEEEQEITECSKGITNSVISQFAKKFNTHPAIIIGRLQHRKMLSYSFRSNFIKSVSFEA